MPAIIFLSGEMKMKCLRQSLPALALGLMLALAGAAFAQNATQSAGDKKASCCASGGCCGDSCNMKKDGMKNHATAGDKDACCCCGDSCDMKKDGMKNHATAGDKDACCCGGDSCDMKKDGMKNHATAGDKDACCCCGDSCDMKDMKKKTGR